MQVMSPAAQDRNPAPSQGTEFDSRIRGSSAFCWWLPERGGKMMTEKLIQGFVIVVSSRVFWSQLGQ